MGALFASSAGPEPPKNVNVPLKLFRDTSLLKDWRRRAPHFKVCGPWFRTDMFVSSHRFVVFVELPTGALPPVNASWTQIPADEPCVMLLRLKRENWNRVSFTSIGLNNAV